MTTATRPPTTIFDQKKISGAFAEKIEKDRAKWKSELVPVDYASQRQAIADWEQRYREVLDRHKQIREEMEEELIALEDARPSPILLKHDYARGMLIKTAPIELQNMRNEELRILRDITHDSCGDEKMLYLRSRLLMAEISGNNESYNSIRKLIAAIERNSAPILNRIASIEERMVNV